MKPGVKLNCGLCHIDLQGVSVTRGGQELLHDVTTHIHCGQLTVLIGQNGAGKTTLIRALLGLVKYSGTIRHLNETGRDIHHLTCGYVPQHLDFDREMPVTVADLMASAYSRRPVWTGVGRRTRAEIAASLAEVEAQELADRPLGRLSGGEMQRVLLALSLHPAPDLLVLDEPISGVDRNGQQLFVETVRRLRASRHMAILMVSHDLELVRSAADYVILLDKTILAQGQPDYVFQTPEFARTFSGAQSGEV